MGWDWLSEGKEGIEQQFKGWKKYTKYVNTATHVCYRVIKMDIFAFVYGRFHAWLGDAS